MRLALGELDGSPSTTRAIDFLAARAEGDARTALNALELAAATAAERGEERVTLARAEDALQRRAVLYDRAGDRHYDYISAWIKATRGSDPDASLYYLAVMLEGGEDPRFIVRRMVILASEDIGNADPAGADGGHRGGPGGRSRGPARGALRAGPGGDLPLARAQVQRRRTSRSTRPRPTCASTAPRRRRRGCARDPARDRKCGGYDYPHAHPGHVSPQPLLPEGVQGARFYAPDEAEAALAERLRQVRRARGLDPEQPSAAAPSAAARPPERSEEG